uniref:AIG1-type G domain-containing protein n=1 Tax=Sinocyclocheilus rhinocerous TaxID=307959 RepID=A0A673MD59_9TELE
IGCFTLVLLGTKGAGKSSTGNTILGRRKMRSVTSQCSDKHTTVSGRSVSVVDTPGFFDTHMQHGDLVKEIARSVYLSSPGPHALLIVFPVDRFTQQEEEIPQQIKVMFGEEVLKYSIILFTHGDQLEETIEDEIKKNSILRQVVQQCGGRFHVFDNKDENNREQVNDLLQMIDTMIKQNGGGYYSNQMFADAQRFRQEKEEREFLEQFEHKYPTSASVSANATLGSVFGGILGGFLGLCLGPLGAAAGAAAGAALGATVCSIM